MPFDQGHDLTIKETNHDPTENFSEVPGHVASIKEEKKIYSATDRGILPFVSADDVAACAVVLLTQPAPPHSEYVLLGPENMSYDKV
jgi:festuclavine dehydrogenase